MLLEKYRPILGIESEVSRAKDELERIRREYEDFLLQDRTRRSQFAVEYDSAKSTYENLKREVSILEENLEDVSFGLNKPHFTFQTSEEYKRSLGDIRERERQMIREKRAAICKVTWTVGDSARDGERMTKQYLKVILRAFNGECDAAVANVSWNNVTKMEERVRKAFAAINEMGTVMQMCITDDYLCLKLDELRLTYEYEQKRYQEREEERCQREFEKAREEAEREEQRFQRALEKARQEAAASTGAQLERLTRQILSFEAKLDEARKNKERAISRAQLTKSGFVYVISNIGSFGERVYKIGMTRRMEPMEWITELGDASVPFPFDLHAMLYSDNAPELENSLHELFTDRAVNLVNPRKEFFRNVEIDEVEHFVRRRGLNAQFMKLPEAREYRETMALREEPEQSARHTAQNKEQFPGQLFQAAGAGG